MGEKNKKQDYISVGELSVGFSENTLLPTDAFIGKQVELHYESGKEEKVTFIDIETLKWETEDQGHRERFICSYNAIMPRSDIYFVDFIVSYGDSKSVSIILDKGKSIATIVTGILPRVNEIMIPLIVRAEKKMPLTSVQVFFEHASVGGPFTRDTPRHGKTVDQADITPNLRTVYFLICTFCKNKQNLPNPLTTVSVISPREEKS